MQRKMISTFKTVLNRLSKKDAHYLGRWNIDYCPTILQRKVMHTNEDHCGICENSVIRHKKNEMKNDEKERIAYMVTE